MQALPLVIIAVIAGLFSLLISLVRLARGPLGGYRHCLAVGNGNLWRVPPRPYGNSPPGFLRAPRPGRNLAMQSLCPVLP